MEYVYKVLFFDQPIGSHTEQREFLFGSLAAIYEIFTPHQIGCRVENLWSEKVSDGYPYENKLCRITKEPVIRKAQRQPSCQRKTSGQ